ncbi:MAG TPA: sulfotransferase, partial [Rubrobacter sp.]|nr:sulfotransferase [Rubrobacter sp.]
LLTEACKRSPEIFRKPLKPPIIVLGLPRSGTTFLHRLLAMDPTHRAVPWWELARPLPGLNGESDRRRQIFQKKLSRLQKLTPDLDSKHYTRVDTPEECIWLLASTFLSPLFWALAPVYGYLDWYMNQDRLQAYYEYRLLLQVLQEADPTRRLVLKSSTHTGAVETLLQTIPGSLLIQTHRNPVETSASLASYFYSLHSRTTEHLDVRRMTEAILSFHEHQIARNMRARDAHPGALFDVYYDRLVADPIGTVRDIYDHYGLAWSEEFEERLNHYLRQNPRGKHGAHLYAPENFGQTKDTISRRFAAYIERFELNSPNGTH